ncbi:YgaP family membrane protein [Jiulongibacter sediminis]|jgi:uncharacterized membrane protein|uniref:Membrane protein n=1 Tax=Jiulongibacter sediminis TaxID=1605367 RepID=A0A0P7BZA7_9BACT|nr:DUF2892 domain-containing protein [Jiulongibacter sediminis]KPM47546.1 membrane protein [Jiulongibacter sediminis]TBX23340.1 membrane protein [Jiulongibacter sediminis]
MKKNMGNADKLIRLIVAVVLGFLIYNGTIAGTLGTVLGVIAVIFLLTSLVSFCPLYTLFGINTCKVKES